MSEVIAAVKENVPDEAARSAIYKRVRRAFEDHDCDTLYECEGADPVFDALMRRKGRR